MRTDAGSAGSVTMPILFAQTAGSQAAALFAASYGCTEKKEKPVVAHTGIFDFGSTLVSPFCLGSLCFGKER